ncbi:MAG: FAD-dependent monooxygenase [Gammaproteobacteria bacterium]|nr:FAD-dependent monooxygenase [Gammaproteobacteria bacterium]
MKIIIIGAGIAGLTLGVACQRAGMEVKIYEKASYLKNIGGGILLWPHGLRYLNWLGLSACVEEAYVAIKGYDIAGYQGHSITSDHYTDLYTLLGGEILPIERSYFQNKLLSQFATENLFLNKTCIAVSSHEQAAHVMFADGTMDTADLIVGADGIHSAVRKNLNPHAALQYSNHCWWGGILEKKYVPMLSSDEVYMTMGVGKLCIVWPTVDERFMWYLPVKMSQTDLMHDSDGRAQLNSICVGWNKIIDKIISAPTNAQRFHLPIHTLAPQPYCSVNRIVLIGDAAHTVGPILGQGASLAIEDAFVLFNCLMNKKMSFPTLLQTYESLRHHRYECMAKLENQVAEMMIYDDAASLEWFQQQLPNINLVTMYQDLIPLVDEKACLDLAAACR